MIASSEPLSEAMARHLPVDPMANVSTLVELVESRARLTPEREAIRFGEEVCSFAQLWRRANGFARFLHDHGVRSGDRVVLVGANSIPFFFAYYGVQRLGAVAVPISPRSKPTQIGRLVHLCGARAVVLGRETQPGEVAEIRASARCEGFEVLELADDASVDGEPDAAPPSSDDLAMLQYTSGTTGGAKAVQLTHRNLLTNVRQMVPTAAFTERDVLVSWLPLNHDMGLIVMTMCPLYVAARLVLLPTSLDVKAWLTAITKYRATMTAAPDFAYRFALRFAGDRNAYDLSSLRFALIGAEPIRPSTVEQFEAAFGLRGVMKPGYGLAEATVGVAFWPLGEERILVDANGVVSVGRPLPGVEVAIVDEGRFLPADEAGPIVVRSPSCTSGYFGDAESSEALRFGRDGFVRTGDIGYLDANGRLFVVGRAKNLIIRGGRNLSPGALEVVVDEDPAVVFSAVVGVDAGDLEGEQIHVYCEVKEGRAAGADWAVVARRLKRAIHAELDLHASQVHLLQAGTIPRTANGKTRYDELRRLHVEGALATAGRVLFPTNCQGPASGSGSGSVEPLSR